jgi:signal transduction histidine kinase
LRLPAPIRVALISLAFGLVITVPVLLFIYHQTDTLFEERIHDRLDDDERDVRFVYSMSGAALPQAIDESLRTGELRGGVALLVDRQGHKLAGNLAGWPPVLATPSEWNEIRLYPEGQLRPDLFAIRTIALPRGERLLLGATISERERMRAALVEALLGALLLAIPLGLIGGWVVLKVAERRARAIANVAARIAGGDFTHRLDEETGGEEFAMLAAAINAMLERIEELVEQLRLVTDSLAHDLRSPLTRMRANMERAAAGSDHERQQQALEAVSLDIDRMLRLISATLEISSTEAGAGKQHFEEFDLAQLLRDICEIYYPVAEERGMRIAVEGPETMTYTGNRQSIGRAVANLVDNAIKYAAGTVELGAGEADELIELWVADRGPGIPPEQHEHALGKYRRLEEARTTEGSGLGLALARAVARLHGGDVELQDNRPGLRVVLTLRRSPANLSLL